jgi:hypothetical protein
MTFAERLNLLAFIRADRTKALTLDRVNKLTMLERALLEWPKTVAAREHKTVAATQGDCPVCAERRATKAKAQKRFRQKARKAN